MLPLTQTATVTDEVATEAAKVDTYRAAVFATEARVTILRDSSGDLASRRIEHQASPNDL